MPARFTVPADGQFDLTNYLGLTGTGSSDEKFAAISSILLGGGYQEVPTYADLQEIPVNYTVTSSGNSPLADDDDWLSGRRRVGMMGC